MARRRTDELQERISRDRTDERPLSGRLLGYRGRGQEGRRINADKAPPTLKKQRTSRRATAEKAAAEGNAAAAETKEAAREAGGAVKAAVETIDVSRR